jgi:hypothetical protein
MTVLDNTPENKNFLSPLNFKFQIKKAPHVNFFIQKVNIPAISIPPPQPNNPFVDEDLKNYLEIWNWIIALGKPENFDQYRQIYEKPSYTGEGIYSDISLMILSSTKMPNYEITYVDAFPVDLSQALFNTVDTDVNYIEASATFKYTYYTITNI